MKTCSKCGEEKPFDAFPMDRGQRRARCRICVSAYLATYREGHREKAAATSKAWREANPERARELQRQWRVTNSARFRASAIGYVARRRARLANATVERFTAEDLHASWVERGLSGCVYCPDGAYEQADHVVPLALGGAHAIANLVPACERCNKSKGSKHLDEWLPSHQARLLTSA